MDESVAHTGTIETLFESAIGSGVSVDIILDPGTKIFVFQPKEIGLNIDQQILPIYKPDKEVIQSGQQNVTDLSIQEMGNVEYLFEFCLHNEIGLTTATEIDKKYFIPKVDFNEEVVFFFESKGIRISTGSIENPTTSKLFHPALFHPNLFE